MPRAVRIYSKDNNFQRADVLKRNREKRTRYGEFLVEGVRSINGAVKNGWKIRAFLYAVDKALSKWAQDILDNSDAETHYELSFELLSELSDKEETSEILAIVSMPPDDLSRIPISADMVVVVFDRPGNPGNLGSSIRSCDGLGAAGVIITGHATDLYHAHTVRGSMGSLFKLPVVRQPSHKEVVAWIETLRKDLPALQVVGTSEDGSVTISGHDFRGPTIIVMGNETFGMAAAYQELCDKTVMIPMTGSASSLNVSCATSIFLYEIQRQRGRG